MYQVRVLGDFATAGEDTVIAMLGSSRPRRHGRAAGRQHRTSRRDRLRRRPLRRRRDGHRRARRAAHPDPRAYVGRKPPVTATGAQGRPRRQPPVEAHLERHRGARADRHRRHRRRRRRDRHPAQPRLDVTAFNGGEKAHRPHRSRTAAPSCGSRWPRQLPSLDLDTDEQLAPTSCPEVQATTTPMRRVVERKDETKKRLGRSPDRADAVNLALVGTAYDAAVGEGSRTITGDLPTPSSTCF
jgi:hypothetical protein